VVGIATLFFFPPGVVSICLLAVGCVVAAGLTEAFRRYVPFMTYASPFLLAFWAIYFLGPALGTHRVEFTEPFTASFVEAVAFGIGQAITSQKHKNDSRSINNTQPQSLNQCGGVNLRRALAA
jgi:urea transporter